MQGMDWSDLQVFLAIARAGQMGRAGAALGVDPTTTSRRLRRLEAALGETLFEQTREGQVLTEAGERLLAKVEAMAQAATAIREGGPASASGLLSGTLRISASEGFGSWFLAAHVPDFVRAHPALTLDLVANSGFLSLSKREADIAVMLSRPKAGPVIARKLSDYSLRLYAGQAYLDHAGAPHSPADLLKGHSLVGYIPDLLYAPELRYLDELQTGLAPALRSSSINAQHHLIAAGAGIGVLPCFMGDADPALVPVLPERRITRSFWLVTHKDTHQLARVRAGRDWILGVVQRHRGQLLPE
ncbi:LysR family transcriptional regulator [Novosphingobium ginsenosidimutans]|uniref:LysR family transcriptional regulator n=1 Tax=Novosphingobium ginsenosidimutans TaxID=1176536 RepID=A0A5B8S0B3_9SPHN|nr:LysR family transcriptional regulator [Novosphingobium ginsenosidimutans]QEA15000.1 LysR family transcriptional regulator [Novosphingobium ginsenosidimutans]